MRVDQQALMEAQRRAYNNLAQEKNTMPDGSVVRNPYFTPPNKITMGAQIIQEIPFLATTGQYVFNFSATAPPTSPTAGNVLLGKTQVFSIYAVQLLIGQGANANNRIYRSRGVTANDDSIYNSTFQMKVETNTYIDDLNCHEFRDVATNANEFWAMAGMTLINPIRIVNGELGTFNCSINPLNPLAALVLTADLWLSLRLHGALGQAKG